MAQSSVGTCRSCGGPLTANALFCPECGAAIPKFCGMCGAPRTSQARFCPGCGFGFGDGFGDGFGFGFGDESSAALTAPPAAPVSMLAGPMSATPGPAPACAGAHSRRRPVPPIALALAAVVVPVAGALGTGIVKLPSSAIGTGTGEPAGPSGPVQSRPPIDIWKRGGTPQGIGSKGAPDREAAYGEPRRSSTGVVLNMRCGR